MTAWYQYPITHGYIPNYDPNTWDTPHYAVDIGMPQDTPITALKSGTVVQSDYAVWGGKQGGGEEFIKPDDGGPEYYYYHLDQTMVSAGQHVSAGQEVGLSGGQNQGGSHPTDPTWSSGPHLHVGYFTNFTSTQVGSRPYGPDITPTINQLKAGGLPNTVASAPPQGGSNIDMGALLTKGGIIIVGLVVLLIGGYMLIEGGHHDLSGPLGHL